MSGTVGHIILYLLNHSKMPRMAYILLYGPAAGGCKAITMPKKDQKVLKILSRSAV